MSTVPSATNPHHAIGMAPAQLQGAMPASLCLCCVSFRDEEDAELQVNSPRLEKPAMVFSFASWSAFVFKRNIFCEQVAGDLLV